MRARVRACVRIRVRVCVRACVRACIARFFPTPLDLVFFRKDTWFVLQSNYQKERLMNASFLSFPCLSQEEMNELIKKVSPVSG